MPRKPQYPKVTVDNQFEIPTIRIEMSANNVFVIRPGDGGKIAVSTEHGCIAVHPRAANVVWLRPSSI